MTPYLHNRRLSGGEDNPDNQRSNQEENNNKKMNTETDEFKMDRELVAEKHQCIVDWQNINRSFGLSNAQVEERLSQFGRNELTPPKRTHPVKKYLKKLFGLFNSMLILSGILGFILYIIDSSDLQNVLTFSITYHEPLLITH